MIEITNPLPDKSLAYDALGEALQDYANGKTKITLRVISDMEDDQDLPASHFFRDFDQMPPIEQEALKLCHGKVLDAGAAAGCHSRILQLRGIEVHPIDISPGAVAVMRKMGIKNVALQDFFNLNNQKFDTILMLMNGIGICGKLENLDDFFEQIKILLHPDGQVLLDSSDILYMFEQDDGSCAIDLNSNYYGEVNYQFAYQGCKSSPFDWLYLDFDLLSDYADKHGFDCEMLMEGPNFDYLARLRRKERS